MNCRHRIASPKVQDKASYRVKLVDWKWGWESAMSALGQKQASGYVRVMSALPPKADIGIGLD
jgi:hypothetical protein